MSDGSDSETISSLSSEKPTRPGVPLRATPLSIDGKYYDPLAPPKLYLNKDGTIEFKGREITRDQFNSLIFWSKIETEKLRRAIRNTMIDNIKNAIEKGRFSYFVKASSTKTGEVVLNSDDEEKLAAYRILAMELGYMIGEWTINQKDGLVSASITRIEENT